MYAKEVPNPNGKKAEFGNLACMRFPPTPAVNADGQMVGALAMVNHNWWCGEWKAKKSAAIS
jgi:hypothetical protein